MQNRTFGVRFIWRHRPISGLSQCSVTASTRCQKTKKADEPEEDYNEILAQCSFCGRFSFAGAGEFPRCFPDGPSYEEWLGFCQELDIDASTASNADPRYDYWWPPVSSRDLALEAAKPSSLLIRIGSAALLEGCTSQ